MHSYSRNWCTEEFFMASSHHGDFMPDSPTFSQSSFEYFHSGHSNYKMDSYNPDNSQILCNGSSDDGKYWNENGIRSPSLCNGDDCSSLISSRSPDEGINTRPYPTVYSPYQIFPTSYHNLDDAQFSHHMKNENLMSGYSTTILGGLNESETDKGLNCLQESPVAVPYIRVVKKRNTANRKERRRTQSINNAYADLRDCIPSVPADTKLSKIKTLRLATSYISYLKAVLDGDKPGNGFCAEIENLNNGHRQNYSKISCAKDINGEISLCSSGHDTKIMNKEKEILVSSKTKGRTGWPEHVWALEFKQEQHL